MKTKVDYWFLLILIMLVIFSLWAIVVVGEAGAAEQHEVFMPFVVKRPFMTWEDLDPDCGPFRIWDPEIRKCIPAWGTVWGN